MEDNPGTKVAPIIRTETPQLPAGKEPKKSSKSWIFVIVAVIILAVLIASIVLLLSDTTGMTSKIRDIFIIFLAFESLIIGVVLVILIVQISLLINLLQNEIKPILETTNDTVNTLKGTTTFISSNMSEPVIKLNVYMAGLKKLLALVFMSKK
ncbi:MAG TPA: hypothetical protein VF313_08995 [Anaerolineaceae bacterium]|jgi:hypothetical protein